MMAAVDEHNKQLQQHEQEHDEQQQQEQQRFSERGRGGLSRGSFVQAAAGSAAAVLALSLVSYIHTYPGEIHKSTEQSARTSM